MTEDPRIVFESRDRRACADRALVLASLQIPYQLIEDGASCVLLVPAAYSARAVEQLMRYDEENTPRHATVQPPKIIYQNALPGILGYVIIIFLFAGLSARSMFGQDWFAAGRIDGAALRAGEWWRTITALTLHVDFRHLAGNTVFGSLFGLFAGRLLGPGVAWLAVVLAAACGNALNALILDASHRAIGASTAVFAALGLVSGYVWRGKLMAQDRWPYRVGPIVGGAALLMYTGTGGPNTDVGAHLMGFLAGLTAGVALSPIRHRLVNDRWQNRSAILTLALIAAAWVAALSSQH